jgi:hypothetical protein
MLRITITNVMTDVLRLFRRPQTRLSLSDIVHDILYQNQPQTWVLQHHVYLGEADTNLDLPGLVTPWMKHLRAKHGAHILRHVFVKFTAIDNACKSLYTSSLVHEKTYVHIGFLHAVVKDMCLPENRDLMQAMMTSLVSRSTKNGDIVGTIRDIIDRMHLSGVSDEDVLHIFRPIATCVLKTMQHKMEEAHEREGVIAARRVWEDFVGLSREMSSVPGVFPVDEAGAELLAGWCVEALDRADHLDQQILRLTHRLQDVLQPDQLEGCRRKVMDMVHHAVDRIDVQPDAFQSPRLFKELVDVLVMMDEVRNCESVLDPDGMVEALDALWAKHATLLRYAMHGVSLMVSAISEDPETSHVMVRCLVPVLRTMMSGRNSDIVRELYIEHAKQRLLKVMHVSTFQVWMEQELLAKVSDKDGCHAIIKDLKTSHELTQAMRKVEVVFQSTGKPVDVAHHLSLLVMNPVKWELCEPDEDFVKSMRVPYEFGCYLMTAKTYLGAAVNHRQMQLHEEHTMVELVTKASGAKVRGPLVPMIILWHLADAGPALREDLPHMVLLDEPTAAANAKVDAALQRLLAAGVVKESDNKLQAVPVDKDVCLVKDHAREHIVDATVDLHRQTVVRCYIVRAAKALRGQVLTREDLFRETCQRVRRYFDLDHDMFDKELDKLLDQEVLFGEEVDKVSFDEKN